MNKSILTSLFFAASVAVAPAAAVIGWVATNGDAGFDGGTAATGSPVTTDADGDALAGSFPAITLTPGQGIVLTGSVNITGNTGGIAGNQFRWGLFDAPGTPTTGNGTGYVGIWASLPSGAIGSIVTANGSTANPFSGSASSAFIDASDEGAHTPVFATEWDFSLSVSRLDATQMSVSGSFTDNLDVLIEWPETAAAGSPGSFTYDSVGILLGGTTNATQASFSNLEVNAIPEPGTALLGAIGVMALLFRRRR